MHFHRHFMIGFAATALVSTGLLAKEEDKINLIQTYSNLKLEKPCALTIAPDGTDRRFVLEQTGRILILPADEKASDAKVFLDLSKRNLQAKDGAFEEGLLGLAFHPDFKSNGKFYIHYTLQDMKRSVISEFKVSKDNPDQADLSSERILLEVPQPFWNHNSGNLLFGKDGYLYVPFGDGGKGGDPLRTAQNLFNLLGKMLRIDINKTEGSRPYGIPADNPFIDTPGARPEIYAYGLRNPWGISFDKAGNFWLADVGQGIWEEINIIEKGGNYGWSFREGLHKFDANTDAIPATAKLIDPIHEYSHAEGISITGGFVYDGEKNPNLKGQYVYGDWGSGRLWSLKYDNAAKKSGGNTLLLKPEVDTKGKARMQPTAIVADEKGEILILDWNGKIFRVESK